MITDRVLPLACAAALAGAALAAQQPAPAPQVRFFVTRAGASLVTQGLAAPAPIGAERTTFVEVPPPAVRGSAGASDPDAAATVVSNAPRFQRGVKKAHYANLPAGSAPLAAAEAFTFGVDAILNPDPADLEPLAAMLQFLKAQERPPLPVLANIGVVDDGSGEIEPILNVLTRRNLLYQVVQAPDRMLDVNVQLGSADFPRELAANPEEFATRVQKRLGNDNRLVWLEGAGTTVVHLIGDRSRARLHVLSYGGAKQPVNVRLLYPQKPVAFAAFGADPGAELSGVETPFDTTQLTIPPFVHLATVDLRRLK